MILIDADDALIAFNTIMSMDTFSLLDDEKQSHLRTELTVYEKYKTRLLRVDQMPRVRQDPLQRCIHQLLRLLRYRRVSSLPNNVERANMAMPGQRWSAQNTALIADITGRIIVAVVAAGFLTIPLVALSHETRKGVQVIVVSICIALFACIVSVMLRASNLEMLVVSSAYAAILSVFVSNASASN